MKRVKKYQFSLNNLEWYALKTIKFNLIEIRCSTLPTRDNYSVRKKHALLQLLLKDEMQIL